MKKKSLKKYQQGGSSILSLFPNLADYGNISKQWDSYWQTGKGSIYNDTLNAQPYVGKDTNDVYNNPSSPYYTQDYAKYQEHLSDLNYTRNYEANKNSPNFDEREYPNIQDTYNKIQDSGLPTDYTDKSFQDQFKPIDSKQTSGNLIGGIFSGLNYLNAYKPPETLYETNGSKGYMQLGGSSNKLLTGSNKLFDLLNKYKVIDSTNVSREDFNKYSIDLQKEYFNKLPSTPKPKGEVIYTETRPVIATIDKETKKQDFTSAYAAAKKQGLKYFDFDKGDGRGVQKYKIEDSKTPVIRPSESGSIQGRKDSVTNTLSNFQSGGLVNNESLIDKLDIPQKAAMQQIFGEYARPSELMNGNEIGSKLIGKDNYGLLADILLDPLNAIPLSKVKYAQGLKGEKVKKALSTIQKALNVGWGADKVNDINTAYNNIQNRNSGGSRISSWQDGGNVNNLLTGSNQLYDLLNKHSVLNNTSMSRDSFNTLPLDVQKEYFSKLPSTPRPKGEVIYSESRPVEFTVNDNIIPTNTEPNTSKETFGEAYSKAKRNKSKYFNFDKGDGKGVKKYKVEDKVDDSDFIEFGDFVSKNKMAFKKTLTKFKQQDGGLVNTTGYTPGTNTFNNPINIIPGNSITSKPMPDNFNISAQPIYKEGLGKSFLYNNTMSDVNDNKAIGFLEKKLPYYKNGGIVEGDYNIDDISQLSNTELKRLRDMGYKIEFI